MREILFRGKRMDNGEWVEAGSISRGTIDGVNSDYYIGASAIAKNLLDKHGNIVASMAKTGYLWYKVDPNSIGQYTGLNDRDGVKVFEGDIVETDNGKLSCISVVKYGGFKPAMFYDLFEISQGFRPKENCFGLYFDSIKEQMIPVDSKFLKVIGNIHDDREILDVK